MVERLTKYAAAAAMFAMLAPVAVVVLVLAPFGWLIGRFVDLDEIMKD